MRIIDVSDQIIVIQAKISNIQNREADQNEENEDFACLLTHNCHVRLTHLFHPLRNPSGSLGPWANANGMGEAKEAVRLGRAAGWISCFHLVSSQKQMSCCVYCCQCC